MMSNVSVYVITWSILHINSGSEEAQIGPSDAHKFESVVWSGLSIGVVCSIIFHVIIREEADYGSSNVRAAQLRTSVPEILRSIKLYQVTFRRLYYS